MVCERQVNLGRGVAVKADAPPRSSPWLLLLKTKQRVHSPAARWPITRAALPQTTDPSWRCWRCWPLQHGEGCSALVQGCFVLRNCLSFTSCSPCRLTVRRQPHHCTSHDLSYKSFAANKKLFRLTYLYHRHSSLPPSHRYLSGTRHSSNRPPASQPYTKRGAHARKWDSTLPHFTHHQTLHRFRCLHIHLLAD